MIDIVNQFEKDGLHKAADMALNHFIRTSQTTPAATSSVTIGQFLQNANVGDYMSVISSELKPLMDVAKITELTKMILDAPVDALYKRMADIQHTKLAPQGLFSPVDKTQDPSFLTVGLGPGQTSKELTTRDKTRSLQVSLPVLTSPMLILTALRGIVKGYSQMTGLNSDIARNPSPLPGTFDNNRTMGQQFGIPTITPDKDV